MLDPAKPLVVGSFGNAESLAIASIAMVPLSVLKLPDSELKKLPATLTPLNWLVVEFSPKKSDPDRTESTAYLVGAQNGKYFLIGP